MAAQHAGDFETVVSARRNSTLSTGVLAAFVMTCWSAQSCAEPAPAAFDERSAAVDASQSRPVRDAQSPAADESAKSPATVQALSDPQTRYRAIIVKEATQAGLVPEIAEAVMAVESGFNPGAVGGVGEIGLMQILPSTARMLGFSGSLADLAVPETNIHYGVTYLARAWRLAGGDLCTATMKYRAGHGETRFSFLSVNYCLAVRAKLAARGFHVTGSVPVATFGERGRSSGCGRNCTGLARTGTVNIAALNMRLSALVIQVRAGR
jgi:soluble lytic murein transglycosylase-like protein